MTTTRTSYLIFDLDGTLIDSSDGVVAAVNYSLRQMGEPEQPPERIKPFIGFPLSKMYPEFTDAPVDQLYRHFQVKANETVVASTVPLPGVSQTLRELKAAGWTMGIATTKIRTNIDGIMKKFDWWSMFDAVVGGDEVLNVKPDPGCFLLALERLGADPDQALVIGDTINDVLAAQAVPMRLIAVASPYGGQEEVLAARPDYFIQTILDLPTLLRNRVPGAL